MFKLKSFRILAVSTSILVLMSAVSCIKDNFDFDRFDGRVRLRPDLLIPLAHGSLTLGSMLEADDSLVIFNPDNTVKIVVREDNIFSLSLRDIVKIPELPSITTQFRLSPLRFDDFMSSATISLGDLTSPGNINEPEASTIRNNDGNSIIFPSIPIQQAGSYPAAPFTGIDYLHLTDGVLELKIKNLLPVEVSLGIRLLNEYDGSSAGAFLFENLGSGQESSRFADLKGSVVRGQTVLELTSFSSTGSNLPVLIDLNQALEMEILVNNPRAEKGRAMVPLTVMDTFRDSWSMNFSEDQYIDAIVLESGSMNYELPNRSGGFTLNMDFINFSNSSGEPLSETVSLDGSGGMVNRSRDLSGMKADFTEQGNSFVVDYTLVIGSDDVMTEFDVSSGYLAFYRKMNNVVPGSATGYFGQEEFTMDEEEFDLGLTLFDRMTGDFLLSNPALSLKINNSTGLPVKFEFNLHGEAANKDKEAVWLLGNDHPGFFIAPVRNDTIILNNETSGIAQFISLPPSRISLVARGLTNPDGPTGQPNIFNFDGGFKVGMELELPLEMMLTDLGFTDTASIDQSGLDFDKINKLTMTLQVTNGFPIGMALDMILYDSVSVVELHRFDNIMLAEPSPVDVGGLTIAGNEAVSEAVIEVSDAEATHLRQATHIIISSRVNTGEYSNNGVNEQIPVKLRTTDKLDFRIRLKAELDFGN
jgi:hypothetical protein